MTLYDLVKEMEDIAASMPAINMIVEHNVRKLNEYGAVRYGVFAWQQKVHNVREDMTEYNFTLFYVDRLKQDATKETSNELEIQSVGMDTLKNVLKLLGEEGVEVIDYTLTPFAQKFMDDCAGAWADVTINAPNDDICGSDYTNKDLIII